MGNTQDACASSEPPHAQEQTISPSPEYLNLTNCQE
jgi:hypothetical protein